MIEVHHGYNAPAEPTRINSYQEFIEEDIKLEMQNGLLCIKDAYQYDDLQEYIDDIPENFIEKIYSEIGKKEALALSKSKHTHVVNSSDIAAKYMLDACCRRLKVIYLSVPFLIDLVAAAERGDIRKRLRYDIKSADVIIWDNVERVHGKWSEFIAEKVSDGEKAQHVFIVKDASKIRKKYDNDFLRLLEFETKTDKKIETKKPKTVEAEVIDFADFKFDRFVKPNEVCLLDIFSRCGIFQVVGTKERKSLETELDNKTIDIPKLRSFKVLKHTVILSGPVLDNKHDFDVAIALFKMYLDSQRSDGLIIDSISKINKTIGMKQANSGSSVKATRRSLERLSKCIIEVRKNDIESWLGGIISSLEFKGTKRTYNALVNINSYLLNHLSTGAYQISDFKTLRDLSPYERGILNFCKSHRSEIYPMHLENISTVLGVVLPKKESNEYKKRFKSYKQTVSRAINSLIKKELISNKSIILNDIVHLYM